MGRKMSVECGWVVGRGRMGEAGGWTICQDEL